MKYLAIFGILSFLLASSLDAQMKQWTDEKGVTHYELVGPQKPEPSRPPTTRSEPPAPSRRLNRTHAGLTLGDEISAFKATKRAAYIGQDEVGAQFFEFFPYALPKGATALSVTFLSGRLSLILATYRDTYLGGWDSLIKETSDKYGLPLKLTIKEAIWDDGEVGLILEKDFLGKATAKIGYSKVLAEYARQVRSTGPKF